MTCGSISAHANSEWRRLRDEALERKPRCAARVLRLRKTSVLERLCTLKHPKLALSHHSFLHRLRTCRRALHSSLEGPPLNGFRCTFFTPAVVPLGQGLRRHSARCPGAVCGWLSWRRLDPVDKNIADDARKKTACIVSKHRGGQRQYVMLTMCVATVCTGGETRSGQERCECLPGRRG